MRMSNHKKTCIEKIEALKNKNAPPHHTEGAQRTIKIFQDWFTLSTIA
ncbi:MAG: hypothetical protein STSR0006_13960 [Lentimicrobium sp.]